jgi:VCBS repeat-containing protein
MKQIIFSAMMFLSITACKGQASPPAKASETTNGGAVITINYGQPSVKGRTIGKDLEPMEGKVWRTGANKATVFEVSKDVKVEGQSLAAGKYGLFTIANSGEWTVIFNKTWDQWGAMNYKEADDALRIKVKGGKSDPFSEKLTFIIGKDGKVTMTWGEHKVEFTVQ